MTDLLEDLEGVTWRNEEDRWRWNLEEIGTFSAKSAYLKLERLLLMDDSWSGDHKRVLACLWKSPAPSKVIAFSWKLFLNRIPTRDNLRLRNVLLVDAPTFCALCEREEESAHHLFLHCEVAREVWLEVMRWFGCSFPIPPNFFIHGSVGVEWKEIKRFPRAFGLFGILIWRFRNNKIFNNSIWEVGEIMEEIKVLSWR